MDRNIHNYDRHGLSRLDSKTGQKLTVMDRSSYRHKTVVDRHGPYLTEFGRTNIN